MGLREFVAAVSEVDLAVKSTRMNSTAPVCDNTDEFFGRALNRFDNRANALADEHPSLLPAIDAVRRFVDEDTYANPTVRALIGSRALHVLGVCEQFGQISEDLAQIRAAKE